MRRIISKPGKTFLPRDRQPQDICTLHSLAFSIVRDHAAKLAVSQTPRVVASDSLRNLLIQDAAQLAGYPRGTGLDTAACRQVGDCQRDTSLPKCRVCSKYRLLLKACSSIDYDDQILLALMILENCPDILKKYKTACEHLLVDEYQDINAAQFKLIRQLSQGQEAGLFVAGDDDQSIYSWRGGSAHYIRNFTSHFGPNAHIENLTRSYRCHSHIIEGALAVLEAYDKARLEKPQFSYQTKSGPKIHVCSVGSDKREAATIAGIADNSLPSKEVLVLLPTRRFAPTIVTALKKRGIGCAFQTPAVGEGLPTLNVLRQWLEDSAHNIALRQVVQAIVDPGYPNVPSKRARKSEKKKQREQVMNEISMLWENVIQESRTLWQELQAKHSSEVTNKIGDVLRQLENSYQKRQALKEFVSAVCQYLRPWHSPAALLCEVRDWVENQGTPLGAPAANTVKLSTLQGAKGLEADIVCIVGAEEGVLPHENATEQRLAESARLLYVSMTRASEHLYLFHARKRPASVSFQQVYGPGKPNKPTPSCFLKEIPEEHREDKFIP